MTVRADLPNPATVSYNGQSFDVGYHYALDGRPVYSSDGRTVVYVEWTLDADGWVNFDSPGAGDNTDALMTPAYQKLTTAGGALAVVGTGAGAFQLNLAGATDVLWGPKPQVVSWRPSGPAACALRWRVQWAMPMCDGAVYAFALMELNIKVGYRTDQSGYTTRTVSGFYRIPQTRQAADDRVPVDSADRDEYLYAVIPGIPDGFRRESTDRQLSDDQCRLDFTVVDTMLPPNAPPAGVVLVDARHSYENPSPMNLYQWVGTIDAGYEMARDRHRAEAWYHFVSLVRSRMSWVKAKAGGKIIPLRFRLAEPQIYGRHSADFSFSYRWILGSKEQDAAAPTAAFTKMLAYSGLWQPVTGGPELFSDSMIRSNVWGPKGVSGLSTGNTTSVIVDLCQSQSQLLGPSRGGYVPGPGLPLVPLEDLGIDPPDPEDSYLEYNLEIIWETADGTVVLKPLPSADPPYQPADGGGLPATGGFQIPYGPAPTPAVVQYRSMPDVAVRLRGSALRWGYSIPAPTLDSVGGVKAYPQNREGQSFYRTSEVGGLAPPLVAAQWDLRWVLPDVPQGGSGPPDVPTSQPLAAEPDNTPVTIPPLDSGDSGLGGSGPPEPPPPPGFQVPELTTDDPNQNGGAVGDGGDRPPIYRSLP